MEISKESQLSFLGRAFYTNGVGGIFVDNGQTGYYIENRDLVLPPSWEGFPPNRIPVTNPEFMRAHLKLAQELGWKVEYAERRKVVEKLENDLVRASKTVRFLVPTKGAPESKNAADIRIGADSNAAIPVLVAPDGTKGLPVFTDWDQFHLLYSDKDKMARNNRRRYAYYNVPSRKLDQPRGNSRRYNEFSFILLGTFWVSWI